MKDEQTTLAAAPHAPEAAPRRWRCPDCGLPNLWDAIECVRCHMISPPDKERWEFKPFVRSERERLTPVSAIHPAAPKAAPPQAEPKKPNPCPQCGAFLWGDTRPCWNCARIANGFSAPSSSHEPKPGLEPDSAEWWRSVAQKLGVELHDARLAHESSEAVLSMAVSRLGGLVEGQPTQRINFLQRIDALVATENRLAASHGSSAAAPWQDIATAPKDGTRVLIAKDGAVFIARWDEEAKFERFETRPGWQIFDYEDAFYSWAVENPDLWIPFPALPSSPPAEEQHETTKDTTPSEPQP